jgi:DNA-directed RNA polymerase sigma subunit (sigma70/sigma32)
MICKRFGFDEPPATLDQIATEPRIRDVCVRQVERRAINRLESPLRVCSLGEP